jgi:hypothetical protein
MGRADVHGAGVENPLPADGGHKGWLLIDSTASRRLLSSRYRRESLQFQYVHIHIHTHTQYSKWQGKQSVASSRELNCNNDILKMRFVLSKQVVAYGHTARFIFCSVAASLFLKFSFIPTVFWAGYTSWINHRFYSLMFVPMMDKIFFSFCHPTSLNFSVRTDRHGLHHIF